MTGTLAFKTSRLALLLVLLILIASLFAPALEIRAQAGAEAFINTGRLNIRSGPSIAYPAITSVPFNTRVILYGRAVGTTWVQVQVPDGRIGWANFIYMRSFARLDSLPITWTTPVPPTNPNPNPPPVGPRYHTVRAGETLKDIAARYGTTWQNLAVLNNLANPNFIYAGQVLLISGQGGPIVTPVPPVGPRYHTVRAGETLAIIAARYGVTWQAIAVANNLPNANYIFAGQTLLIPAPGTVTQPPPAARIYIVQAGDRVYEIARRFGVTPQAIIIANGLYNANLIYPGQRLIIP